jgi:hypothetical protein
MLIIVFSYNDVIAAVRFNGSADVLLNRMDAWILNGTTVSSLARGVPPGTTKIMQRIYDLLYAQIGGCFILLALRCGRAASMRFIGTIAAAYYLALVVFFFLPATGPYYLSAMSGDGRYVSAFVLTLNSMRTHLPIRIIGADYYIAMPCLHVTQPLISIWFVRKWKPVAAVLSVYCLALIPAILLLEQHYVVDLIGGGLVAAIVIATVAVPVPLQAPKIESVLPIGLSPSTSPKLIVRG